MKQDETTHPAQIGVFGADAVAPGADLLVRPFEQGDNFGLEGKRRGRHGAQHKRRPVQYQGRLPADNPEIGVCQTLYFTSFSSAREYQRRIQGIIRKIAARYAKAISKNALAGFVGNLRHELDHPPTSTDPDERAIISAVVANGKEYLSRSYVTQVLSAKTLKKRRNLPIARRLPGSAFSSPRQ